MKIEVKQPTPEELEKLGVKFVFNTRVGKDITVEELRKNYDWRGGIWVGETNLLSFSDENEQKDYFLYAIDLADKSGFTGFCIFYFRDGSGTTGSNGILHNDFTPKPAYDAIKQIIQRRR
mgnify:CR=1 FL=1